jgi:hypothetical protein
MDINLIVNTWQAALKDRFRSGFLPIEDTIFQFQFEHQPNEPLYFVSRDPPSANPHTFCARSGNDAPIINGRKGRHGGVYGRHLPSRWQHHSQPAIALRVSATCLASNPTSY